MLENEGTQTLAEKRASLKPRLSVTDFVLQLWRKSDFSPKLQDKILNGKPGFEARKKLCTCTVE